MITNRTYSLVLLFVVAFAGCSATRWNGLTNPFGDDSPIEIGDPLFANSKPGKVREIQRIAAEAKAQSPAEQTQAAKSLVSRIHSEDDRVLRLELIRALGSLRTPIATEGLRTAIGDPRDEIRVAACEALRKLRSAEALVLLREVLATDPNLDVRVAATRAIADFEGREAIAALLPAINDPDPALQYTAVQSMKRLHSEDLGNSVAAWQQLARGINSATDDTQLR